MNVQIKILNEGVRFHMPEYGTPGSAGIDLRAVYDDPDTIKCKVIRPGDTLMVSTGVSVYVKDPGYAAMILPRSGLGTKSGIILANTVGLIDSDYQGPLMVCLWNRSNREFVVSHLDKVAQLIIVPVVQAKFQIVDSFDEYTERGEGGFGSTGKS
jgi:dUTP pyrophosphatase